MKTFRLETTTVVPRPIEETFEFFADAGNLEAITPPWLNFEIVTPRPIDMSAGTLIDYRLRLHGIPLRWKTRIAAWEPPFRFVDEQLSGPYRLWRHEHIFENDPAGSGGTRMTDRVEYAFFGGPLTPLVNRIYVRRDLDRIFEFRRTMLLKLLAPRPEVSASSTR
ncbi:MAG TPA: SRPBCC family protein [Phycisphaerales bacterium]|nr:SRPBCC family protein [Phycisphaerales bacterium]